MKTLPTLASVAVTLIIFPTLSFAAKAKTYTGQVMDSACAKMGSHDAGYKMTGTNTPKDCTLACLRNGSTLMLYNPADKTAYELSDQKQAEALAGQDVKVEGTLDKATKTLHVDKIEPAS
ncbi:MAG: DUF5818 domain-containing protein [Acidobacteriaceae bacterium]